MLPEAKRIKTKQDLNRFLGTELRSYKKGINAAKLGGIFLFPISERNVLAKHTVILRKTEFHKNNGHKLRYYFYMCRLRCFQNKYAIHIPPNCCDEGLKLIHVGPILLNPNVSVGKNCALHINTGLVAGGLNSDSPTLGNGVVVGIGAVILGGVTIANNVAIGANAVVNKDILEENVSVAGVPAKIIGHNGRLEWNKEKNEDTVNGNR